MQPDHAVDRSIHANWTEAIAPAWRRPLASLALAWLAILVVTARDWMVMADQWWNISTYNHVLLVPPIIATLVWMRRDELAKLTPRAWWPGLVAVGGALSVWLLGTTVGVNTISQAGAIGALQMAVLTLLGPRVAAGLLFPLAYCVFLIPFGDELVPALQMITAEITIALTHLSGIPAEIDGIFIDTPVGLFEVAEACSGVKFLIAMIALGVLVAQTCFTRWSHRAAFLAACVIVPIVANGIRAWGTVYIAQFQGMEFAAGFDHIFYGWVFFAIVIVLVLGAAWRFFDRSPDDPAFDGATLAANASFDRIERFAISSTAATAIVAMLALFGVILAGVLPRTDVSLGSLVDRPTQTR